ncbi:C25 family cysteine peptidase [bacterium]|nr:C25 family cysteine peptidase [bacterium]
MKKHVQALGILAGVVALAAMAGCGRRQAEAPEKQPWQAAIQPAPAPAGFQVVRADDAATSIVVTLRWPAGAPDPDTLPALVFCLPEKQQVKGRVIEARLAGRPVNRGTIGKPTIAGTFLTQPLQVESAGYLRHWPLYRINLPASAIESLRGREPANVAEDLDVVLQLTWPTPAAASSFKLPQNEAERYWRRMADALVVNKSGLDKFAVASPPPPGDLTFAATDPRALVPGDRPWARLRIDHDGLYKITRDDLIRAGIASDKANPDEVRIFSRSRPVPLIRAKAGDGTGLEPGVYLWATAATGPYTRERIYWLTFSPDAPDPLIRMRAQAAGNTAVRPIVRRQYHRDRDNRLVTLHGRFLAVEAIRWIELALHPAEDFQFPIELADFVPGAESLRVKLEFLVEREVAALQPRIEVRAANKYLGIVTLNNYDDPRGTVELPATVLIDGRTTLTLRMVLQQAATLPDEVQESGVWLDKIDIDYNGRARLVRGRLALGNDSLTSAPAWTAVEGTPALALDMDAAGVAREMLPLVRSDGRVGVLRRAADERVELFAAGAIEPIPRPEVADFDNLADAKEGADLLIVTHREFDAEARRLGDFHKARGWRVRVADIQHVYDSFSDGEFTPVAIRRLLACAMRQWRGGVPAAVLLVGDCNSDYLGVARQNIPNWVPTYTFSYGGDSWASDYWFTMVAGDDELGDYVIGRLPVASSTDLKQIVDKVVAYEANSDPGPWRSQLGYVSDDGEFPEVLDGLRRNNTPPALGARRVFLNEIPLEENWYLPKSMVERKRMKVSRAATDAILDTFRRGVAFLTYYGHGSPNIWADERIWFGGDSHNSDNLQLAGLDHPAFVACMTCNSGAIDYPERPWNICISEDMLRVPNGGAIGLFVPSGPGITYIHKQMSEALNRVLFGDRMRGLGEVTTLAKLRYSLAAQPRELIFMYLLLGDPLVNLLLIDDWARLDLKPGVMAPGAHADIAIKDVPVKSGKWSAQLVRGDETVLWQASGDMKEGKVALAVDCPTTASAGDAILRIQAWNDVKGWAAAGTIAIQRPVLTIADLHTDSLDDITIANPGKVPARGELTILGYDDAGTHTLDVRTVSVAPSTTTTELLNIKKVQAPAFYEVRLRLPEPPDDPKIPQVISLVKPARSTLEARPGWLRGSLRIEKNPLANRVNLTAWAQSTTGTCSLLTHEGAALATGTMTVRPDTSLIRQARFEINTALFNRLAGGALRLNVSGDSPAMIMPLSEGRVVAPKLRIVPESIRVRPRRPTEGQTIFISCEVENAGTAPSEPCGVELRKGSGGISELLPDAMGNSRRDVPRLAPGRRVPVELRWDPFANAGHTKVQIRLETGVGTAVDPAGHVASLDIEALTKAAFKVNKVWAEAGRNDLLANRMKFTASIANNGQTDARRVMVSFYRSDKQTPETEVGQIELDRVPGNSTIDAQYTWNFKPGVDYTEGAPLPKPTVRVWLKGSSQRFSSSGGEVND